MATIQQLIVVTIPADDPESMPDPAPVRAVGADLVASSSSAASAPDEAAADRSAAPVVPPTASSDRVTVTRPEGALVLTQICGQHGAIPADGAADDAGPGSPAPQPAIAAVSAGSDGAPLFNRTPDPFVGTATDPVRSQYPYPESADGTPAANYPTGCVLSLGNARLVATASGRFFEATGVLNQMTVTDTSSEDNAWTLSAAMGTFESRGSGHSALGGGLGLTPQVTAQSAPFTDADGRTYSQAVFAGPNVNPKVPDGANPGASYRVASANGRACDRTRCAGSLGSSTVDARVRLLLPASARPGVYAGTLTVTVTGG